MSWERTSIATLALAGILAGCGSIPRSYVLPKEEPYAGKSLVEIVATRSPIDKLMSVDEGPTMLLARR